MGIRIIYGKIGTGKTTRCFKEVKELIESKKEKIYIITPEQFSFTAEKKLLEELNKKAVINAEVITLSRIAHRVLMENNGVDARDTLSQIGKSMLIYHILNTNSGKLKFLGKSEENIDIVERSLTEFKKHSVSVEKLNEEIEKIDDIYLKTKLQDIHLVYSKFQESIQNKFIEESEMLNILYENIDNTDLFNDSYIYIDEFLGFTKQEYEIISKIAKQAKSLSITIATDNLEQNTNPDIDIYYSSKQTLKKILNYAKEYNVEIDEYVKLEEVHRFKNKELGYLSSSVESNISTKYEENVENIHLFLAKNRYSEIENVAINIYNQTKDNKYRYREIAVISQQLNTYSSLVRSIFARYNIPVFIDEKRDLNQNIIVKYVLSILDIITSNFSNQAIFNFLKIGIEDIDEDDIFKLENYATKWGINRNKWKKEFIYEKENKKEEIEELDEIRKKIILPLFELKEYINNQKNAMQISKELYKYLMEKKFEEIINQKIKELKEKNLIDLANEYEESYKIILSVLNEIVTIFGEEKITYDKYTKIFKNGLNASGLGKIPGTQDQVIFGDVERTRSNKVKVVYIIGINDGSFPSINTNEGFLNDNDREVLKNDGLEIAKGTLENIYEEKYNIYKTFSIAEEKVFLSYSSADNLGASLRPAILINKIKKNFIYLNEESDIISKKYEIINQEMTYEHLLEKISIIKKEENNQGLDELWNNIYWYFKNDEKWNEKLNKDLKALEYTNIPKKINKEKIEELYGTNLNTSVYKLEQFQKCAFSYYLKYGLDLKPRDELKVYSFDTGTFMHNILDEFFKEIHSEKIKLIELEESDIEKIVADIIEKELIEKNKYIFTLTVKYKILVERLKKVIIKAVKYIVVSLVESDFKLTGTEVAFGNGKKYDPITINTDDGKEIKISGVIDRVDTGEDEENKYIRIIDYKSSVQSIDFSNLYSGIQIQLVTYLNAINEKEDLIPAGVYYFSLIEKIISADSKITEEEIEEQLRNEYKMKGIVLADVNVIKMQDHNINTSKPSKIIQAGITKDGGIRKNWTTTGISEEEFKVVQEYVKKITKEIAQEIMKGKIDINPYYHKKQTPCDFCEYKSICGFDPRKSDNKYNVMPNMSKDDVLIKMKEELN